MITLLTALFYLWLVITILLVAMWFLRRQDLIKGEEDDDLLYRDSDYDGAESASVESESAESDSLESESAESAPAETEPDQSVQAETVEESTPEVVVEAQPDEVLAPADEEPTQADQAEPAQPATARKSRRKKRKSAAKAAASKAQDSKSAEEANAEESPDTKVTAEESGSVDDGLLDGVLLEGVALPYDLTTANERVTEPERHVILLSTNSDAEAVGTAFADELVKLGYEIEPDGDDQAKAVRGDEVLSLRISPNAGTRGSGKYRRYPTAGDTDVAIEVWTGSGSPPKLAKS